MHEPHPRRLPPRVFEPEHLWGALGTFVLNLLVWSPYIILLFVLAATCQRFELAPTETPTFSVDRPAQAGVPARP